MNDTAIVLHSVDARHELTVSPNQAHAVAAAKPRLLRAAPFDYSVGKRETKNSN